MYSIYSQHQVRGTPNTSNRTQLNANTEIIEEQTSNSGDKTKRFRCPDFDDDDTGSEQPSAAWWPLRRYSTITCTALSSDTKRTSISWSTDSNGNQYPLEIRLFEDSTVPEETIIFEDMDSSEEPSDVDLSEIFEDFHVQSDEGIADEEDVVVRVVIDSPKAPKLLMQKARQLPEPILDDALEQPKRRMQKPRQLPEPLLDDAMEEPKSLMQKARLMPEPLLDISENDGESSSSSSSSCYYDNSDNVPEKRVRFLPIDDEYNEQYDESDLPQDHEIPPSRKISVAYNWLYTPMAPCQNADRWQRIEI